MYCGDYSGPHVNEYDAGIGFNGMTLPAGDYFASFDAMADVPFVALVQQSGGEWARLGTMDVPASDEMTHYEMAFHSDTPFQRGEFHFHLGTPQEGTHTFCVDNAVLKVHPTDYATGGTFDDGPRRGASTGADATVTDAGLCLAVPAARRRATTSALRLNGRAARLRLHASLRRLGRGCAGANRSSRPIADPSVVYADATETPGAEADATCRCSPSRTPDDTVDLAFELGGGAGGEVCLDNVQLLSGGQPPAVRARNRAARAREPARL